MFEIFVPIYLQAHDVVISMERVCRRDPKSAMAVPESQSSHLLVEQVIVDVVPVSSMSPSQKQQFGRSFLMFQHRRRPSRTTFGLAEALGYLNRRTGLLC